MGEKVQSIAQTTIYFGLEIPIPPRTIKPPVNGVETAWLSSVEADWQGYCNMAAVHTSERTANDLLYPPSFTTKGLRRTFTLTKEAIRKDILMYPIGTDQYQKIYSFFVIGKPVEGAPKHNPWLQINRLELFQLLALVVSSGYQRRELGRRQQIIQQANERRFRSYEKMMQRPPEDGGPLITAR